MADTFFLGIGGTGAKTAEALVHLSAAGLGPERCWLALIDQDRSNGNVGRTNQLCDGYSKIRNRLKRAGTHNLNGSTQLFKTEFVSPASGSVWCPVPGHGVTLADVLQYKLLRPELQELMDCLYLTEERELPLDEGFRSRPSIGAATILASGTENHPLWEDILVAAEKARQGQQVKIFIVGSIFGGTGAAGFPTLARAIRRALEQRRITSGVHIGGALLLPYFTFPPPNSDSEEVLADAGAFIEQAQGALAYYYRLFKRESVFDSLYVVGWDPLIEIRDFKKGGPEQKNPPLIPEIYAALAAQRFFAAPEGPTHPLHYIGRGMGPGISWEDLPAVENDRQQVRTLLGRLVRFALAFHSVYRPSLTIGRWRSVKNEPWFRRLLKQHGVDLASAATQELMDLLDGYSADLLSWIAGITFGGAGGQETVNLVQASQFASHRESTINPVELKLPRAIDRAAFDHLIQGERAPSLTTIFEHLTYADIEAGDEGLGVFLSMLHTACSAPEEKGAAG